MATAYRGLAHTVSAVLSWLELTMGTAVSTLVEVADKAVFVWPMYLLFILPMSIYVLQDVIDSRWRPIQKARVAYTRSTMVYVIFSSLAIFYFLIQLAAGDHKEAAATVVAATAIVLLAAQRILRGWVIDRMLNSLGNLFMLTRGGHRECWAGPLSTSISDVLMDDDWPGSGARVRWLWLLVRVLCFPPRSVHTFNAILDVTDFVLMVVVWAWACHAQEPAAMDEKLRLSHLAFALDRGCMVSYMLTYGADLRALDAQYHVANVGDVEAAVPRAYNPCTDVCARLAAAVASSGGGEDEEASNADGSAGGGPHSLEWVTKSFQSTLETLKLCTACMVRPRVLRSTNRRLDWLPTGQEDDDGLARRMPSRGVLVAYDSSFAKEAFEVRAISTAAANGALVTMMLGAARSVVFKVPLFGTRVHWDPVGFTMGAIDVVRGVGAPRWLQDMTLPMGAPPRNLKRVARDMDGKPRYTDLQAKLLARQRRAAKWMQGSQRPLAGSSRAALARLSGVDPDSPDDLFKKLAYVDLDQVSHLPAFVAAYATSIVCLLYLAAQTTWSEQSAAIAKLPPLSYDRVGVPRMALVCAMGLQRQLAHLAVQDHSELSGRRLEAEAAQVKLVGAVPLLRICRRLLDHGERFVLHLEAMAGVFGGPVHSWASVTRKAGSDAFTLTQEEANASPSATDPVLRLVSLFSATASEMVRAMAAAVQKHGSTDTHKPYRWLAARWHLWPYILDNLGAMMAVAFSATLCGAEAMGASKANEALYGQASDTEEVATGASVANGPPELRRALVDSVSGGEAVEHPVAPPEVAELTALYHAVMLGWGFMMQRVKSDADAKYKVDSVMAALQDDVLRDWAVLGQGVDGQGNALRHRVVLSPVAVARRVSGVEVTKGQKAGREQRGVDRTAGLFEAGGCHIGKELLRKYQELRLFREQLG